MKNLKIIIAYDGAKYNGWQKQGNTNNTIQQKIEDIFSRYFEETIEISGSGRTDALVNALGQVANFHISDECYERVLLKSNIDKNIINKDTFDNVRNELNSYMPLDIRIIKLSEASDRFHARLNATGKYYSYRIDNGEVANVFERKYLYRITEKLDTKLMKQGAEYLIGEHDFKSFCANKKMKKSTVRNVYDIKITKENGIIRIDYFGNGFLYNMVRIMTGTLIEIGLKKRTPESIIQIIEAKNRECAGYLVPGNALFLEEVYYDVTVQP